VNLNQLSASELAPLLRAGEVTAEALLDATLAQIARLQPTLNAFTLVDEDGARLAAREADQARTRGETLPPLHGIPFTVKDLVPTKGLETAYGSHLMAGNIPDRDAAAVARLKAAGAILLGKTTTPEFAHKAITDSPRYGPTRNPWNPDSCCGILGLKATQGRIPNEDGADLFGCFIFLGAMSRTTADLVAMLNIISGPHPGDPWSRGTSYPDSTLPADARGALKGLRVHYKPRLGNELLDDGVALAMEQTLALLADAGVIISRSDGREDWGNELARIFIRAPLAARMARFSEAERAAMDPSLRAAISESQNLDHGALQAAPLKRTALYQQTETIFEDADLLLTPCLSAPPPAIGHSALDPISINGELAGPMRANWYNYPAPFNLTGHPAISIPAGITADGLPIGLQAVAPWFEEQRLITLAAALEQLQPWPRPPIAMA
jgi:aspartyl-tRNA(Asn)/glutamyl-tRNA(Gln) amidotransferase subunit A